MCPAVPGQHLRMKMYADSASRRTGQVTGDLLLLGWVFLWLTLSDVVRVATLALARPGRQIQEAGTGLAGRLRDAGEGVSGIPLVGDDIRSPFDGAGTAADQIAAAGAAQVEAVQALSLWLGLAVATIPILIAAAFYLPRRWRFIREATAGQRFLDSGHDLDLFALRSMAHQPLYRLARISPDPAGAWRAGDAEVVRALAVLELRDSGLAPPAQR